MTRDVVNGVVRLTADNGMWLTNGETNSKQVYIGKNCSEKDWSEVDEPVESTAVTADEIASALEAIL